MASIISGYEYDIFISYRQKDNLYDGWVTQFIDNLKRELEATFKEEISVYFDINPHDGLLETYDVDASLKDKLKCLVFIPIISRTYCDPKSFAWEHEFKAFIEQSSNDQFGLKVKLSNGNVASRVLPVRIHDLDIADIKECESVLGGVLRGIEFIYKTTGVNRPLRSGEEKPHDNLNRTIYRDQINKLSNAVKEIVSGLVAGEAVSEKEKIPSQLLWEESKRDKKIIDEGKTSVSKKRKLLLGIVSILIVGVLLAIYSYPKLFKRDTIESLRTKGKISVAVMPFQNMTNDTTLNYLQEVIQDNLINYLSNNSEELIVRQVESTNSLIQSQGLDSYASITPSFANSISQKLKADVYVHGSIKQMGSTIRINAQLINSKTRDIFKSFQTEGIYKDEKILSIIDSLTTLINNFLIISKLEKENYEFQGFTSTNSIEAYRYYILGRNAYYKYDFDNAINWLNQSLAIDSNLTWAMFFLSAANQNGGSINEAKKWGLKLYEKKDKLSIKEKLWSNYQYAQFLEPDEAIKYLVQLKEVDTQNPYVYFTIGWNYYILNQFDDAIIEFEKALEIYNEWKSKPMGVNYYSNLGSAYHKAGQFKKEKKLYKVAEKDFPNSTQLVYNQAILELSLGDTTNANHFIEMYKSFIGKNSTSEADIYASLAEIYSKAEILDKAEEYYRKAVSLQHDYTFSLALFLIDKGRNINEGLDYVNKILDLYTNNYYFLNWKGWAFYKQGRFKEALELIQRSDSLKPIFISTFYYHLQEAKKAIANQKMN